MSYIGSGIDTKGTYHEYVNTNGVVIRVYW
jgi:hypothetical protein